MLILQVRSAHVPMYILNHVILLRHIPFILPEVRHHYTFNSCNMDMSVLPDMYTQIPRASGLRDEGVPAS